MMREENGQRKPPKVADSASVQFADECSNGYNVLVTPSGNMDRYLKQLKCKPYKQKCKYQHHDIFCFGKKCITKMHTYAYTLHKLSLKLSQYA